jgi:hypothetical protein
MFIRVKVITRINSCCELMDFIVNKFCRIIQEEMDKYTYISKSGSRPAHLRSVAAVLESCLMQSTLTSGRWNLNTVVPNILQMCGNHASIFM